MWGAAEPNPLTPFPVKEGGTENQFKPFPYKEGGTVKGSTLIRGALRG
jgi:hypothetical protein